MSLYLPVNFSIDKSDLLKYFSLTFLSTVFIPLLYFLYKRKQGKIINRDAVIKEERNDVYLISMVIFSLAYIISVINRFPLFIQIYLLNFSVSTIGVYFINKKIKISIHSMTAAGTATFLIFLNPVLSTLFFIFTIFIMWSRVALGVHSVREVIFGMIYGFCVTLFVTMMVLEYAT